MAGKTVHVEVVAGRDESGERLINRFLKKIKKENLMEEIFKHFYYEKPSEVKQRKKKKRAEVLRKLNLEKSDEPRKTKKGGK